ncbi:MAG: DUF1549 and DUF1553 domain-containing protein [Bryobacteraceae bacterium]
MRLAGFLMMAAAIPGFAEVSYVKDVQPIFNKVGCTSGPCHGGAKGKSGFKMSLRGYDPEFDFRAVMTDLSGRRINRTEPAQSLILLKPTMAIPHGGGARLEQDSPYYKTVLQWLSEGAVYGDPVSSQVTKLDVNPPEFFAQKPGPSQQLKVVAHYADGSSRDVTDLAQYNSSIPTTAEISEGGVIKTLRKGEAAMLVRYEGKLSVVNVTALSDKQGFQWKPVPEFNYIDTLVNEKMQRLHLLPSELTTDAEFLRRVSLDLTGLPATPEEVRAFLNDKTENRKKRTAMIDKLMARPEFVNHWSVKWGDLLQVNRTKLGDKGMWAFRDWIRESLAENKPYDKMVRELVTAKGSTFKNPPANFLRFTKEPKLAMETTTQLFLGVRMVCAQCHDHPFEKWTQNQYFSLAAFFAGVGTKPGPDSEEEIVYEKRDGAEVTHPKDGRVMTAKFLFGSEKSGVHEVGLRESLADWLTSKDNPFFAEAMANRMWSYFFGHGIIDPVDDIRASNPPSNPKLLAALTKDFSDSNFDLKHLIRTIVSSRTYQLGFKPNEWNADDELNFSKALPRRLSAEELFDGVNIAAGTKVQMKDLPEESKAQDFPDPHVGQGGFLDVFGRPERQTSCECERRSDVSLVQALNLLNGSTIADAIADSRGRVAKLVLGGKTDHQIVEELYLSSLNRMPATAELDYAQTYLGRGGSRAERAQDLLWALLNSNGFLFNR